MKINLQRLEELKRILCTDGNPDYENYQPLGIQIIMEALRGYIHNNHVDEDGVTIKLLTDYGILEIEEEGPIVKPHKFNTNG